MSAVGDRNDLGLPHTDRYRILTTYRTIAMVGLSSNYYNASSFAGIYLDANGYDLVPVNPAQAAVPQVNPVKGNPSPTHSVNGGTYKSRADVVGVGLDYVF